MSSPRLYLITPPLAEAADFAPRFEAALAGGAVASVLVRLARGADARKILTPLLEIAQRLDVALLVEEDIRLAARLDADGVHLSFAAVAEAVEAFKGKRIVGAGGVALRDDAMSAGEAGADYVMFGEPGPDGEAPAFEATLARVDWWAPIFQTPCVAYAARLEDVAPLFAAGAEFVALGAAVWDALDPETALKRAASA